MLSKLGIVLLLATIALVEVKGYYHEKTESSECLAHWTFGGGPHNLTYYKICDIVGSMAGIGGDILVELAKLDGIYAVVNATYEKVEELDVQLEALGVNLTNKFVDVCGKLDEILSDLQSSNEEDSYTLAFRGTPGTGGDIYRAWTGADPSYVTNDLSSPCAIWPPTGSCTQHYRNSTVFNGNNWAETVVKVKYVLYDNGVEVQNYVFNAIDSDITSWFASYRLQDSTCCTCSTFDEDHPQEFSLEGTTTLPSISKRRFQIVTESHSCLNYKGLTLIVNEPTGGLSAGCDFDSFTMPYPHILYSYGNCGSNFNIRTQYGQADALGVFVMTKPT